MGSTRTVALFGLGYVGTVTAACLARSGHEVVGVDRLPAKVDRINQGQSPVLEPGLSELIAEVVQSGRLRATTSTEEAIANADISMICVGTPSNPNGSLDTSAVEAVAREIGTALRTGLDHHVVIVRSTVTPGTVRKLVGRVLEESSGRKLGVDLGLASNPEFLREGRALADFEAPPKIVIGADDDRSAQAVQQLYDGISAPCHVVPIETAELVKYADNSWHALKVAYANEIGNICKAAGVDSHELMSIFCSDETLNISSAYLKPGFAFGGSCLPKDVRALTYASRRLDLDLPVIHSLLESNHRQIQRLIDLLIGLGRRNIGILGFSFKAGTDDLRESPIVEVTERLIGKGYEVRLLDHNVNLASLLGTNRQYIETTIPHIQELMVGSIDELLAHAEVVIVGTDDERFHDVVRHLKPQQVLIDLVRLPDASTSSANYIGINW